MRQSLSDTPTLATPTARRVPYAGLALALLAAIGLAVAAVVDQAGGRALVDHATEAYRSHGEAVSADLLYGLIYCVAGANIVLWAAVLRSASVGSRWAALLTGLAIAVGVALAGALLGAQEYGEQVFPARWGLLALVSPAAGVLVLVRLARRRSD
ncbi:hypothetical protein [Nocardioides sp. YIM 152315]|uniref:hypothetical protein n=1 Tax=Nocardioides sp. YIM 152315 TaxID=3031760 RepID=UPI0023DC2E8F|nr:hypothetical protein [Nocardioides sp. YIM 152315]MDF1603781.1 hypothetical protein [Nocardioides sp. YIM 152315]